MNNYIIPTVGMRGKFSLSPPLDQLCLPGEEYTCQAVRRLADYIGNNEDPLNDIYLMYELTEADFKRDMLEDMFIASLQSQSGHWVYVPVRYIQTFPDPGGVAYRTLMMGVNLGPQPNEDDFLHLEQEVTDLVIKYVGVVPKIKMVQTSKTVLVPREKHDEIVAARSSKKTAALTDGSRYREVYLKYERALAQVKALENYIRCQLCCPGCFSNTPTIAPTAAPTPEPTLPPVPTVQPISIDYKVSAPPPVVTEGEPVVFVVTGHSTPVVDNLYWEIEKTGVPLDEYFSMSGTVLIVDEGAGGDFYATLVDPGTYTVCLYVDSTKAELLSSSTFDIAVAPTEAPTPQPTPAPPPPCCIPVSAPCSAPPPVEDVQYRLIPGAMSVDEGSCLAFNVVASRLPSIESLYWEVAHGTTTLSDIANSSGNVALSSGTSWSFNVCVNSNSAHTGDKTFMVKLYTDSTKTDLLDSTGAITLTDKTPAPTEPPTTGSYSITGSPSSVIEGEQFSIAVGAPSNMSNATLYWQVTHQSTATRDFVLTSGSVTLNDACVGSFKITTSVTSAGVEGDKNFVVRLYRDALRTDEVAVSSSLTIVNQAPTVMPTEAPVQVAETYALSVTPEYVNEGSQVVLTATGSVSTINKTVYWQVVHGTSTAGDFGTTSGSLNLGSTASGSFTLATVNNTAGLQGDKTFTVRLYSDSGMTTQVATTPTITIKNENVSVNQCDFSVDTSVSWGPIFDQQLGSGQAYTVASNGEFQFSFSAPSTIPVTPANAVFSLEVDLKIRTGSSPIGTWSPADMVGNVAVTRLSETRFKANLSPGNYYFSAQYKLKNPTGNTCGVSGYRLVDMTTEYATVVTEAPTSAPTEAPIGYTLTASPSSINEGGVVGLTIAANSLAAKNKTLYWKVVHGTSTAGDFGTTSGSSTLGAAGTGSFNVTTAVNAAGLQSDKTFTVGLYSDSSYSTLVTTSQSITIKNLASTNPDPTYTVTTDATSYNEGSTINGTIYTTNVPDGTVIYLSITHGETNASDFNTTSGNTTINGNVGYFVLTAVTDTSIESTETFTIKARTGSSTGTVVATTGTLSIINTTLPTPTYSITSDSTNINGVGTAFFHEGETATFVVTSTNVADGTALKWKVVNTSTSSDDLSTQGGDFTINGNVGSFTLTVKSDSLSETTEYFKVQITRADGTVLATSGDIGVINVSVTEAPTQAPANDYPVITNMRAICEAFVRANESLRLETYAKITFNTSKPGTPLYITTNMTGWVASRLDNSPTGNLKASDFDDRWTMPTEPNRIIIAEVTPSRTDVTIVGAGKFYSQGYAEFRDGGYSDNRDPTNVMVGYPIEVRVNGFNGPVIFQGTWQNGTAVTEAPVDPVTNFVAKANSAAFDLSFDTTLIGNPLYITADRRSTGGTDNDYVGTVTPTSSAVTLSGSSVKYSVGQVVSIKTGGYNGATVEQTTAIAMAEPPAPASPVITNMAVLVTQNSDLGHCLVTVTGNSTASYSGRLAISRLSKSGYTWMHDYFLVDINAGAFSVNVSITFIPHVNATFILFDSLALTEYARVSSHTYVDGRPADYQLPGGDGS